MFSAKNIQFKYQLGNQWVDALKGVTIDIADGEFVCLTGPSGSGKTTLLNLLGLIEPVQQGDLFFSGLNLKEMAEAEKNQIRRFKVGFVFQSFQLFPVLRADENVEYFLTRQGVAKRERDDRVRSALDAVGLWEHRAKKPLEMSGGQRQRVAIARAIAKNPSVIIADEPTASLDSKTGQGIMEIFQKLNRERKVTIVVSSHDPMVHQFVEKKISMKDGVLV